MRVLVVEDERALREQLESRLRAEGFVVDAAADGETGLHLGLEYPCDVAIVDLGLPKLPGIELIRALRRAGRRLPILILTAHDRWQEKVEGLGAGADDYLVKPFHVEELLARLNALIRRSAGWSEPVLRIGEVALDTRRQQLEVSGRPVMLTAYEYKALEYLMLHAGRVVSKSELTEHLYGDDDDRDSNVIEVFIARLRRKLDAAGAGGPIVTLRGRGYRYTKAPGDDA